MEAYVDNEIISQLIKNLKSEGLHQKAYSDVIDESGNQYVDLVQEGGGVLGIALLGYTFVMEQAGIRFFSLAGTSAGAINSMMMAGMAKVGEPATLKTLEMLHGKDLSEIVDGDKRLWKLVKRYLYNRSWKYWFTFLNIPRIYNTLVRRLGLNPGNDFMTWIEASLAAYGISSLVELEIHRSKLPGLFDRNTGNQISRKAELKIIASDITSKSKITFPEMAELYWHEPASVNPACFVRASISIPFFFQPYIVDDIPGAGTYEDKALPREQSKWRKHTGYRGKIPATVHFVDGGMLSNFPINAFHRKGVPAKPTFGARLSSWRVEAHEIKSLNNYCNAMISTMRQLHDYDFLLQHHDYKHLICSIDCDTQKDENGRNKFNLLDFNMDEKTKVELFNHGAQKAYEFLKTFDWQAYKALRLKCANV